LYAFRALRSVSHASCSFSFLSRAWRASSVSSEGLRRRWGLLGGVIFLPCCGGAMVNSSGWAAQTTRTTPNPERRDQHSRDTTACRVGRLSRLATQRYLIGDGPGCVPQRNRDTGDSLQWRTIRSRLRSCTRSAVIAPDRVGFGTSIHSIPPCSAKHQGRALRYRS
jgi:hypothetical protein